MQRSLRKAHYTIWLLLAFLIPLVLGIALMLRPTGDHEQQPVPLDAKARQVQEENQ